MNKSTEQMQLDMYGMNEDDINVYYMDSITAKLAGLEMVVAGILSDCQEELYMTNPRVQKQLNVAKYILSQMMKAKRKEEV